MFGPQLDSYCLSYQFQFFRKCCARFSVRLMPNGNAATCHLQAKSPSEESVAGAMESLSPPTPVQRDLPITIRSAGCPAFRPGCVLASADCRNYSIRYGGSRLVRSIRLKPKERQGGAFEGSKLHVRGSGDRITGIRHRPEGSRPRCAYRPHAGGSSPGFSNWGS